MLIDFFYLCPVFNENLQKVACRLVICGRLVTVKPIEVEDDLK